MAKLKEHPKTRDLVLPLVLKGYSRQEIADLCNITKGAVSYHIAQFFIEYQVKSTAKLILAVQKRRAGILVDPHAESQVKQTQVEDFGSIGDKMEMTDESEG